MSAFVRDPVRLGALGGLALTTAAAWAALLSLRPESGSISLLALCLTAPGPAGGFSTTLAMWVLMAGAMMLPTAAPALDLHARLMRRGAGGAWQTGLFALGYLIVWGAAAMPAAGLQFWFDGATSAIPVELRAGGLIALAGIYQGTALKRACLDACQSPLSFFLRHWRDGPAGALHLGIRHGVVCVGCCWALMGLMLIAGAMNPMWMVLLGAAMTLEKTSHTAARLGRAAGQAMALAGIALMLHALM